MWALTEVQVDEWQESYGEGIAVIDEARKALAWVKANPARAKTASGMPRFLVNWLVKECNRGGRRIPDIPSNGRPEGPTTDPNEPPFFIPEHAPMGGSESKEDEAERLEANRTNEIEWNRKHEVTE